MRQGTKWNPVKEIFFLIFYLLIKESRRQVKDLESINDPDANKMLNDYKTVNATTNQQLIGSRNWMMDKTAQIIERSKKKVTLFKKVWNHCKRKINYLSPGLRYTVQDNINVGTETAAALKAQLLNPNNKDIGDIPGLAPPAMTRELLWNAS
ncbi:hypothetical protein CMV_025784 [Castanea mollissima]|uniref:Uncharacterized protein n=1 Tax=Castanea mollissima TaxID=60419 RepID=A0A8J4QCU0_9ROSI|nr:hypothetical protein CMV_025784 [Castanea mollissima]